MRKPFCPHATPTLDGNLHKHELLYTYFEPILQGEKDQMARSKTVNKIFYHFTMDEITIILPPNQKLRMKLYTVDYFVYIWTKHTISSTSTRGFIAPIIAAISAFLKIWKKRAALLHTSLPGKGKGGPRAKPREIPLENLMETAWERNGTRWKRHGNFVLLARHSSRLLRPLVQHGHRPAS